MRGVSESSKPNHAIHHSAADGFARGAETYVRGRPDYPSAAQGWLKDEIGLRTGRTAVDLGAGTGKFTKYLLASGARVIAVEPVPEMLSQLRANAPGAESTEGHAEHIPLDDGSVDAVVCAQAFHWFATEAALGEIHRVLRPGGMLGLIWNVRDQTVDWVRKITKIIAPFEGDAPRYDKEEWRKLFPAKGFGPLSESHFPHVHAGSPERVIVDRVASISFIAALLPEERAGLLERVRALIASTPELHGKDGVAFPYVTAAYSCVRT